VRISVDRKIGQIGQRRATSLRIDRAERRVPADDLRDFDVEKVRRVQGLSSVKQATLDRIRGRGPQ
jgi:hypothetical protein